MRLLGFHQCSGRPRSAGVAALTTQRQRQSLGAACAAAAVLLIGGTSGHAQTAENVAVVINEASPDSQRLGEHYARARNLPDSNVLRIRTSLEETIDRPTFTRTIETPLAVAIRRANLQDRILYLVLTKGVPIRVNGTLGPKGTMASVDSELTLLYRRMVGNRIIEEGPIPNPYFLGDREISAAHRFGHRDHDIYLVSRLDAFTVEDALGLVERAAAPKADGQIVLDQRDALVNRVGEDWLEAAAKRLGAQGKGERVLIDRTPKPARDVKGVLGYFSWGSTDPQNRVRAVRMEFVPGAIAADYVATSARTFRPPPDEWAPSATPSNKATWYGGSGESLVGDLIREGITGVAGHVAEPLLQGSVRPQVLFPAYVSGFNLIESFYLAMPYLGWQTVVIGDPFCAPVQMQPVAQSEIDAGPDATTELPSFFSKRRLASLRLQAPAVSERALALSLRAETHFGRGDARNGRAALEEAVQLSPGFVAAITQLAALDEQAGQRDAAIERYRRILELRPNDVFSLNNLAYGLAVHQKKPEEALPFAKRAVTLAPNNPLILDTFAWIQHLLGDDATAAKVMSKAVPRVPGSADVRLHAAVIFAAVGARAVAQNELDAALKLQPELEKSDEVRQVREQIQKLTAP